MAKSLLGSRFVFTLALLVFLGTLGTTGYFWLQNDKLTSQIDILKGTSAKLSEEMETFQTEEAIYKKIQSFHILEKAKHTRITWSKVVKDILDFQGRSLEFNNFSSDSKKLISINGWAESYESIRSFLKKLKSNDRIQEPFISSISKNNDRDKGGHTFVLTFYYQDLPSS